jgi:hypothetical protein
VEITYKPGTDLSGVMPSWYILEDRGANNPVFGQISIKSATASGNKVTLIVDWDTKALSDNSLIYTGAQPHGERTKEAYGLYCTLLWYRGIDGIIYFGNKDSGEFKANTIGKGYQLRPGLELRLRHFGEDENAALCYADSKGQYVPGGPWQKMIENDLGKGGFVSFDDAGIKIPSTSAGAPDGDQYAKGWFYIPEDYTGDRAVPMVFCSGGNAASYWKLPEGTNSLGNAFLQDTFTTSWMYRNAIVVFMADRSGVGGGGLNYDFVVDDVNTMKYFLDHYNVDRKNIIIQGVSRSTFSSSIIIMALAGRPYSTAQLNAMGPADAPRNKQLDKKIYDFTISTFICEDGSLGGTNLVIWRDADQEAIAKTGLRIWTIDGEQDFINIVNIPKMESVYKAAGYSDEWIKENIRYTCYNSEIFSYWGELDHAVHRMAHYYFMDTPYYGPDNTVVKGGNLVYFTQLQPGDTYSVKARGEARGDLAPSVTDRAAYKYTVYATPIAEWAIVN